MSTQREQPVCIRFCIELEHSSMETVRMLQEASGMGNWWLAASSWQCACSCIMSWAEFFGETSNHPGDSAPLQPRFGTLWLLAFPKTKITFEREGISDHQWDLGKYEGAADGDWQNYVRSQGAYFQGDWGIVVSCTMFLVSSSIDVSIFKSTWLDTFWTDLVLMMARLFQNRPWYSRLSINDCWLRWFRWLPSSWKVAKHIPGFWGYLKIIPEPC